MCKSNKISSRTVKQGDKITPKKYNADVKKEPLNDNVGIKKARKKYMGMKMANLLAKENPTSSLLKSYKNTIFCANTLTPNREGSKLITKYCKNRWCPTCQSIRTATLINGYKSQLEAFEDPYFVTLTRPTVTAEDLNDQHERINDSWRKIRKSVTFVKRKYKGILKREITIRPNGHYHYHLHLVVESKECAEYIVSEWLRHNPDSTREAQDFRAIKGAGSLLEIFKYFTKLFAKNKEGKRYIDYKRLDVIFQFMRGKRVFQPFGSIKAVSEEVDENTFVATLSQEDLNAIWNWSIDATDWINEETGECLTGYKPNEALKKVLDPTSLPGESAEKPEPIKQDPETPGSGESVPAFDWNTVNASLFYQKEPDQGRTPEPDPGERSRSRVLTLFETEKTNIYETNRFY